jgi:hypothetical protein
MAAYVTIPVAGRITVRVEDLREDATLHEAYLAAAAGVDVGTADGTNATWGKFICPEFATVGDPHNPKLTDRVLSTKVTFDT